ncbi:MAG TPA: hypothetical protein VHC45_02340 [Gaiellaceae bacterium]|nr:hypothetical protein [Gaiellaceae bacterium]
MTELLKLPVRVHGIHLARPIDALVDAQADRVVGLELHCGDGARRFVPFAVLEVRDDEIAIDSALTLLDERDLDYYRPRTRRLADLPLADPWVDADGSLRDAANAA